MSQLWDLETIGISGMTELKSREVENVKQQFLRSIKRTDEARYVVSLPWISEAPEILDNRQVAVTWLESVTKSQEGKVSSI